MRYHLDPVGGVAGDMFAAAMLDCHPEWQQQLKDAITQSGLHAELAVDAPSYGDSILNGRRFVVVEPSRRLENHRAWSDVRKVIETSVLSQPVRSSTLTIFELLAEAEAAVHGKALDDVVFHEVGNWDSIADIISAAWLIDRAAPAQWTCTALPMGRGRVASAHGDLPVPAPAVTRLLSGFPVFDDGRLGERITPTGAAILRYLNPTFEPHDEPMTLVGEGYGFGTKKFDGISNVLRVLRFDTRTAAGVTERIAQLEFEVDDQSPEDLAVGLQRLRQMDGVLDVLQASVYAKKLRLAVQVRVLAQMSQLDSIIDQCLVETTTLGVRWQVVARRSIAREMETHTIAGNRVRLKRANRPGSVVTCKAEMSDLADAAQGYAGRERLRRLAESEVNLIDDEEKPES